jgi:hypothetical protein
MYGYAYGYDHDHDASFQQGKSFRVRARYDTIAGEQSVHYRKSSDVNKYISFNEHQGS